MRPLHYIALTICLLSVIIGGVTLPQRPAQAAGCCSQSPACTIAENAASQAIESVLHMMIREVMTMNMMYQQRWFMNDFFRDYILRGLMNMVEQLTVSAELQVFTFGAIMDAKEQLETQRLFDEKRAEAHRDYKPDVGMCTIGTAARGLAVNDRNAESSANALTKRMIDRQLGLHYSSSNDGTSSDVLSRIEQYRRRFCDRHANGGNTSTLCLAAANGPHINRDINYSGTVGMRRTISLNLNDNVPDADDQNIFALAANLYGNRVFERTLTPVNNMVGEDARLGDDMVWYLDKRAITAKRSVAQNSFNEIVGMRAAGTAASATAGNYLFGVFQQLGSGITDAEARQMLGSNPSYYALLELMAQKVYQDPEFYTNLYDSPTNVLRKNVAMQAINLMLDRDTYKSELRTEALLSQLLEAELVRYQKELTLDLNRMNTQATPTPP